MYMNEKLYIREGNKNCLLTNESQANITNNTHLIPIVIKILTIDFVQG